MWSRFPGLPWFWSEIRFELSPWHIPLLEGEREAAVREKPPKTVSRKVRRGTALEKRTRHLMAAVLSPPYSPAHTGPHTWAEPDQVPSNEDRHVEHSVRSRVEHDIVGAQCLLQADLPLSSAGKNNSCITRTARETITRKENQHFENNVIPLMKKGKQA